MFSLWISTFAILKATFYFLRRSYYWFVTYVFEFLLPENMPHNITFAAQ